MLESFKSKIGQLSTLWWCAGIIGALAVSSWAWDLYNSNVSLRQDLDIIQAQRTTAEANWTAAREGLNEANSIIADLEARPPAEVVRTIIRDVPADCEACISNYAMPVRVDDTDGLWYYSSPDIFTDPGKLELTDRFDAEIIQPYRDALDICEQSIDKGVKSPLQWTQEIEARAGIGLFGYEAQAAYKPFRFGGSRFSIAPVAWMGVSIQPEVVFTGAVGIEARIGK